MGGLTEAQINDMLEEQAEVPQSLRRASSTVSWWQVGPSFVAVTHLCTCSSYSFSVCRLHHVMKHSSPSV